MQYTDPVPKKCTSDLCDPMNQCHTINLIKISVFETAGSALTNDIYDSALTLVVNILSLRVGEAIDICFDCMDSRFRLQVQSSMNTISLERGKT